MLLETTLLNTTKLMNKPDDATLKYENFQCYTQEVKRWIKHQWNVEEPRWFITIQWSPAPYKFEKISTNANLFKNKLLCALYSCSPKKIPNARNRTRFIWFHERVDDLTGRLIYHSHLHLTALPEPYSTKPALSRLIAQKVAPGFHSLKNLYRSGNPAVLILDWNKGDHSGYNFKDYYTLKHTQDSDMVLDTQASDLLSY
jgi:hypothetical protein